MVAHVAAWSYAGRILTLSDSAWVTTSQRDYYRALRRGRSVAVLSLTYPHPRTTIGYGTSTVSRAARRGCRLSATTARAWGVPKLRFAIW